MIKLWLGAFALATMLLAIPDTSAQQSKGVDTTGAPKLTRIISRHEARRFGYGGTVSIVGAPHGTITIEGWTRNEVDVRAEIELRADTEEDLSRLAVVNNFVFDEDLNHLRLVSTGTHDKVFMRAAAKKFPKTLLGLPWKIDYRIRVPVSIDLEINAGRGNIDLKGIDGNIRLSAAESETKLQLASGTVAATIAIGKVNLSIPVRSWRGGGVDIRVAVGDLTVELPPGFNGDIDAEILRSGRIVDSYGALEPREKPGITEQTMKARTGAGGAFFKFTVGDGTIFIKKQTADSQQ